MTQQDFILKAVAWTGLFVPGLTTRLSSRVSLINPIGCRFAHVTGAVLVVVNSWKHVKIPTTSYLRATNFGTR